MWDADEVVLRQPDIIILLDRRRVFSPVEKKIVRRISICGRRRTFKHQRTIIREVSALTVRHYSFVFQDLPEPNRACLVGVYAVTLDPLLSLYGIIYVTWYTRHLPKATRDSGSFRYTRSRDYQTPTRHVLLGYGRCWKTKLISSIFCQQMHRVCQNLTPL